MSNSTDKLNISKSAKKEHIITHYTVTAIFFICVTLAAIIFYDTTILYWYVLGALMEIFHKFPARQLDKDDRVNLDYRRHYEKDFTDYRR
jgi:hypothetical protein